MENKDLSNKNGPRDRPIVDLPLGVRLSIESTCLCCPWSDLHAKAEELLGHPVWSHEFGSQDFNLELKIAVLVLDEGHQTIRERERGPLETLLEMMA